MHDSCADNSRADNDFSRSGGSRPSWTLGAQGVLRASGALFFYLHPSGFNPGWEQYLEVGCDLYTVWLDTFAYAHEGSVEPRSIGPAGLSEEDMEATDWVVYHLPERE